MITNRAYPKNELQNTKMDSTKSGRRKVGRPNVRQMDEMLQEIIYLK